MLIPSLRRIQSPLSPEDCKDIHHIMLIIQNDSKSDCVVMVNNVEFVMNVPVPYLGFKFHANAIDGCGVYEYNTGEVYHGWFGIDDTHLHECVLTLDQLNNNIVDCDASVYIVDVLTNSTDFIVGGCK